VLSDILTLREEEVEESEIHDVATLRPHASSGKSPVLQLSTAKDETQLTISQAEGMTSVSRAHCRCIQRSSPHSFA
jgi:hypothetical protein